MKINGMIFQPLDESKETITVSPEVVEEKRAVRHKQADFSEDPKPPKPPTPQPAPQPQPQTPEVPIAPAQPET